jgi:putative cell wall-binding protein
VLAGTFISREATKVVIVNERDVAGALAGGVLARANLGPLLLSPASGLTSVVKREVSRMSPIGAYVIGNTSQLSDNVIADLTGAGVPAGAIQRISGPSKAAVAAKIALAMDRRSPTEQAAGTPAFTAVAISRAGSAESTAVSDLAAARRIPVLYVDGSIPQVTLDALHTLNVNRVLVIGGRGVVSATVFKQLNAGGLNPTRLGGPDQYATSRAVLRESIALGLPTNQVFVADGDKPMHPALLGYSSARIGGLLLLTPGASTAEARSELTAMGLNRKLDRLLASTLLP